MSQLYKRTGRIGPVLVLAKDGEEGIHRWILEHSLGNVMERFAEESSSRAVHKVFVHYGSCWSENLSDPLNSLLLELREHASGLMPEYVPGNNTWTSGVREDPEPLSLRPLAY